MTNSIIQDIQDRLVAGHAPSDVAAELDLDVGESECDGPAVLLPGWVADDGNCDIYYPDAESGKEAAREYVEEGDWGVVQSTIWVLVRVWRKGYLVLDGDVVEVEVERDCHTIDLDPEEPECDSYERVHDWQAPLEIVGGCKSNPGVWGNGGGVIYEEVCMRCGCARKTDTWAQDPETGEQGLEAVWYEPGKYADQLPERLRPDADTSHETAEEWYDSLGYSVSGEHGDIAHPFLSYEEALRATEDDVDAIVESHLSKYPDDGSADLVGLVRYALNAAVTASAVKEEAERAVEAYEKGDLSTVLEAIESVSREESDYGDDPIAQALRDQLLICGAS